MNWRLNAYQSLSLRVFAFSFDVRKLWHFLMGLAVINLVFFCYFMKAMSKKHHAGQYRRLQRNLDKSGCKLEIPDPWDHSVIGLFPNTSIDYSLPQLNGTSLITTFEDGAMRIINKNFTCMYRCFEMKSVGNINYDAWIEYQDEYPDLFCEFIDVACDKDMSDKETKDLSTAVYRMTYVQAIEKTHLNNKLLNSNRPNVLLLVFDSVSHSSAIRKLPKTLKVLREDLQMTEFGGHAKVGLNSNPNGAAFLMGVLAETSSGDDFDYRHEQSRSIWFDFNREGYVVFVSEDDVINLTFGEKEQLPGEHYLWPYWTHAKSLGTYPKSKHRISHDYIREMLKIYTDRPIFALNWVDLAHEQVNDLDDDFFADYFRNNQKLMKESFIIIMGDHGMRFGELRSSQVGRVEDNLPFLGIVLPEQLRNRTDLNANLRANSKILTSHFDLYVTLWDVLINDFKDFSKQLIWTEFTPAVRGQSLLRPIEPHRSCQSLEILFPYCPCEEKLKKVLDSDLSLKLAQFVVDAINDIVPHSKCEKVHLETIVETEKSIQQSTDESDIYRITLKTEPNRGLFQVMLQLNRESGEISQIGLIDRINRYGNISYCTDIWEWKRYCSCKVIETTEIKRHWYNWWK